MSLFDDLPPRPRPGSRSAPRQGAGAGPRGGGGAQPAPPAKSADPGSAVETVTQLTMRIDAALRGFGRVAVEGEVSRPKVVASGHVFFTLKDEGATLDCKVWRTQVQRALPFRLEEGMRVVAHGGLDVYAPYGKHSLVVERVEQRGIGALLAELERLKARLAEEGLFGRRRPLPRLPRRIGVVTSRDADAWRDFLRTRSLRWPEYPVLLAHSRVQGRTAAREVAAAIGRLDAAGVDVIVVCRGGGALEDLWCFNEEPVARAIWSASVPVVTGVGHETDTTLVDLVADHRAHTPTDAAQTVIPDRALLDEALERQAAHLADAMGRALLRREERLQRVASARVLRRPEALLEAPLRRVDEAARRIERSVASALDGRAARLERAATSLAGQSPAARLGRSAAELTDLAHRLAHAGPRAQIEDAQRRLDDLERRLVLGAVVAVERREKKLEPAARALRAVSPLAVLERGYSITRRPDGSVVRSHDDVEEGTELETLLSRGSLRSTVTKSLKPAVNVGGDDA